MSVHIFFTVADDVQFLHDAGIVVYWDEEELSETVVLNPQWLAEAMACVTEDCGAHWMHEVWHQCIRCRGLDECPPKR